MSQRVKTIMCVQSVPVGIYIHNRFNKLSLDQTDFSSDKDSPSLTSPTSTSHTSTSALTEQPRLPSHVTSHKSQHAVGQGARVGGVPVIISLMKNRSGNTKGGSVYLGAQKMESSSEGESYVCFVEPIK